MVFQVPKAGAGTPASVYPHCLEDGNGWSRSVVSPVPKSEGPGPPARVSAAAAGGAKRRAFTDAGAEGTARQRGKPILDSTLYFQQVTGQQLFAFLGKQKRESFPFSRLFSCG